MAADHRTRLTGRLVRPWCSAGYFAGSRSADFACSAAFFIAAFSRSLRSFFFDEGSAPPFFVESGSGWAFFFFFFFEAGSFLEEETFFEEGSFVSGAPSPAGVGSEEHRSE